MVFLGFIIYFVQKVLNILKKISNSKKGCPYDNTCIESFLSSIKKEELYKNTYFTLEDVNMTILKYIEDWYNIKEYTLLLIT